MLGMVLLGGYLLLAVAGLLSLTAAVSVLVLAPWKGGAAKRSALLARLGLTVLFAGGTAVCQAFIVAFGETLGHMPPVTSPSPSTQWWWTAQGLAGGGVLLLLGAGLVRWRWRWRPRT
ncbi:hypothetical protein K7W42_22115 [Deinococcus sp. HMF7604]|uniref:hypothetical protein n=1 Tax=Deinococcus betulae TaxID=2873312 RepID=UPI001CCCDDAF|nr:hypothetical protein [Deinococcus betulae]MBZ9753531.1 hypothetical protein [Deinococcus betulae]